MRLRTIWTIPAMTVTERLRQTADWAAFEAARNLPARVKYWATLQNISHATMDSENIPGEPVENVLKNIPGGPK